MLAEAQKYDLGRNRPLHIEQLLSLLVNYYVNTGNCNFNGK